MKKALLLGIFALVSTTTYAKSKFTYNSISACVKDFYDNSPLTRDAALETCIKKANVEINYRSFADCVKDLYDNTSLNREAAQNACLDQ